MPSIRSSSWKIWWITSCSGPNLDGRILSSIWKYLYLNEKISEVVDYISARVKMKEQEVQVDIQEDFWAVTDSYVLSAILKNALSNAIKYSPKGSTINLRAFKDGGKIQIQIQDHGVGFADRAALPAFLQGEGLLPRKPGTTGEKGNGIGLVIIRDFLRKMGQKLQIETGEEGTTLSFHLEQFSMG
jgi:two-component system sensor histidine kinase/response regulator